MTGLARAVSLRYGFIHCISTGNWVLKRFKMDRAGVTQVLRGRVFFVLRNARLADRLHPSRRRSLAHAGGGGDCVSRRWHTRHPPCGAMWRHAARGRSRRSLVEDTHHVSTCDENDVMRTHACGARVCGACGCRCALAARADGEHDVVMTRATRARVVCGGARAGALAAVVHLGARHDDACLVAVREDAQDVGPARAAAVAVGHALSGQ